MNERLEIARGMPDGIKWLFAIVVLGAAITAFYVYADQSLLLRVVGVLLAGGVALAILIQTEKGRIALGFVRDARTEVRKVVWPTRKETVQTTMIVIGVVIVVSILLWIVDGILAFLMRNLLQGG